MLVLTKTAQEQEDNVRIFFEKLDKEKRQLWLHGYNESIKINSDDGYKPKVIRFKWMLPLHLKGRDILIGVMKAKQEIDENYQPDI